MCICKSILPDYKHLDGSEIDRVQNGGVSRDGHGNGKEGIE